MYKILQILPKSVPFYAHLLKIHTIYVNSALSPVMKAHQVPNLTIYNLGKYCWKKHMMQFIANIPLLTTEIGHGVWHCFIEISRTITGTISFLPLLFIRYPPPLLINVGDWARHQATWLLSHVIYIMYEGITSRKQSVLYTIFIHDVSFPCLYRVSHFIVSILVKIFLKEKTDGLQQNNRIKSNLNIPSAGEMHS